LWKKISYPNDSFMFKQYSIAGGDTFVLTL
jgi:hypothetical protein